MSTTAKNTVNDNKVIINGEVVWRSLIGGVTNANSDFTAQNNTVALSENIKLVTPDSKVLGERTNDTFLLITDAYKKGNTLNVHNYTQLTQENRALTLIPKAKTTLLLPLPSFMVVII